jgi:hypothetical protein
MRLRGNANYGAAKTCADAHHRQMTRGEVK